jgi:hypothetical protein
VTPTVRHTTRHRATTGLGADARNRAARTFLQGLAYTTGLALALVIYNAFQTANGWGGFDWDSTRPGCPRPCRRPPRNPPPRPPTSPR